MDATNQPDEHVPEKFLAGRKLLDKFTGQWEQLHRASESNINKSKSAIDKLNTIDRSCMDRLNAMENFVSSYRGLSGLEQQINNISCDLNNLERSFIKIEEYLLQLAERNEMASCEKFLHEYRGNYEAQAQMAKIQSELARDRLMAEHLQRVQDFERHQQQALDERRKVLGREFEAEKLRYLEKTRTSTYDKWCSRSNCSSLL